MLDKKALKILFDTYWSSAGWKDAKQLPPPDDYTYAKATGYMFDPIMISHDEIIEWLQRSYEQVTKTDVADAFIASLGSRRLELRSALGSYAIATNFPPHRFSGEHSCNICGLYNQTSQLENLNILNFERYKWGGVRHLNPLYAAFDLERFAEAEKLTASSEDVETLNAIVKATSLLDRNAKVRDLEKILASVVKSNKAEREVLIQILSYCGIFQPTDQEGFFAKFVNSVDRVVPSASKIDWEYPVCWWQGKDGVNKNALQHYFPQLK